MKTKILFLLCFFLGIGLTQLAAQNSQNGKGSVSTDFGGGPFEYWQPVYDSKTGGDVIDMLYGTIEIHGVLHFFGGEIDWARFRQYGESYSENTGELFKVNEIDTQLDYGKFMTFHFNLIGDQGSHYVGTGTIEYLNNDYSTGIVTNLKFISTGKHKLTNMFK